MNISTNCVLDTSYSDNSHIFGVPFGVYEGYDAVGFKIEWKDLRDWIEKVHFLEDAGIEFHFSFIRHDTL